MTFSAYISDQSIFFEMTIFVDWQLAVRDSLIKFQPSHGSVDFLGNLGVLGNPNLGFCFYMYFKAAKKGPLCVKLKNKKKLAWRKASGPGAIVQFQVEVKTKITFKNQNTAKNL